MTIHSEADAQAEGSAGSDPSTKSLLRTVEALGFPWQTQDPFLFCVHHKDDYPAGNAAFGPKGSLAGRRLGMDFELRDGFRMYHGQAVPGFPQHPHRGFETVTVVRKGLVDHADSLGAAARYGQGDTQWLTAGEGIVHSEMFPLLDPAADNPLELFQIWLNLAPEQKMIPPRFSIFWDPRIPRPVVEDAEGRKTSLEIIAGRYRSPGQDGEEDRSDSIEAPPPPPDSWAADPEHEVAIWTLAMEPQARFTLPPTRNPRVQRTLYLYGGSALQIAGQTLPLQHCGQLDPSQAAELVAGDEGGLLLLLQGLPIGAPTVQYGPFVMNSREEVAQAFADYRQTGFGGWPWDQDGPVHGGEARRFARSPDGREERPPKQG